MVKINKSQLFLGDYVIFPNGTIGKVIDVTELGSKANPRYKFRKVSSCKGRHSSKDRIGKPYTYQSGMDMIKANKVCKIINTELILELLFDYHKSMPKEGICSLCRKKYYNWGHNPEPLKRFEERCCTKCNREKVGPERLKGLKEWK